MMLTYLFPFSLDISRFIFWKINELFLLIAQKRKTRSYDHLDLYACLKKELLYSYAEIGK